MELSIVLLYLFFVFMLCNKLDKEYCLKDTLEQFFYVLSFTLLISNIWKFNKVGWKKAGVIEKLNTYCFIITLAVTVLFVWITECFSRQYLSSLIENNFLKFILIIIFYYAISRVNEIFIAFIRDAKDKLKTPYDPEGLKFYQRIRLAMISYIELILLYGIIQFLLSFGLFDCFIQYFNIHLSELCERQLNNFKENNTWDTAWNAIYFSGITIATIGYGDLSPRWGASQFLAIYEVVNGITLLVVSFTIYVSRSIDAKEYNLEKKPSSDKTTKKIDENLRECSEIFEQIIQQQAMIEEQRQKQKECLKDVIGNLQSVLKKLE